MNAMEMLAKMESVHAERKGERKEFELHRPTKEVCDLIEEFDGFVELRADRPSLVSVWVGEEYRIDPNYSPPIQLSELFEGCETHMRQNPSTIGIRPIFLFPVGDYPIMVAEFQYGYADGGELRTETRQSRFRIELGEEHSFD